MTRKWTSEQQAAIDTRNKHILVSAAAGSGKTAILVERIIRQITDDKNPIDIDELLVMTFTKAAALEMKERIAKSLEEELLKQSHESDKYKRLKRQLTLIDSANISTIDSFCLSVIREHIDKIELDPSFRIADESELELLKPETLDIIMEELYQKNDGGFIKLLNAYTKARSDDRLREYIQEIYSYAMAMPRPLLWLDEILKSYETQDFKTRWEAYIVENIVKNANDIKNEIERAIDICDRGELGYKQTFISELALAKNLCLAKDYAKLREALLMFDFPNIGRVSKDADAELKNIAKGIRDNYKKFIKERLIKDFIRDEETLEIEAEYEKEAISTLINIVKDFIVRFKQVKLERNVADFADLEHYALEILYNEDMSRSQVALEYAKHFKDIYIDEYQDSNYVQESILSALDNGNVFMVGDVKQSIYAFRQARPELFLSKYNTYTAHDKVQSEKEVKVVLKKNFRSRETVLKSINDLFFNIMSESVGGIDYDKESALYVGADFEKINKDGLATASQTELLLLEKSDFEEDSAVLEASMIAKRIKELKNTLLVRAEDGSYRQLKYSDIVILLRSMQGQSEKFIDVLSKEGIPAYANTSTGYFDAMEVKLVLAILSAIDNPYMNIDLSAFLHSPIIDLSDNELALITAYYRKYMEKEEDETKKSNKVYEMCQAILQKKIIFNDPDTEKKIKKAFELLFDYRKKSSYMELSELLRYIYDSSGYLDIVSLLPAGHIRRANLLMLTEMAKQYESIGYKGLFNFIKYIDNLKQYNTDYGEASVVSEYEDTVRLMSIHKSKGLEFPVCFVSGLHKRFNTSDYKNAIIADSKLGIACDYVDLEYGLKSSSIKKNVLKYKKRIDNLGEELRVLYVAMSRAKEKLILTAVIDTADKAYEKYSHIEESNKLSMLDIMNASSYLDFLLLSDVKTRESIETRLVKVEELMRYEEKKQIETLRLKEKLDNMKLVDDNKLNELVKKPYDYISDIDLDIKFSVSDIKKSLIIDEEANILYEDKEKKSTEPNKASIRGNAYHKLMQVIDFDEAESLGLSSYIDKLYKEKLISKDYKSLINLKDVENFMHSDLADIMSEAFRKGILKREAIFTMGIAADELGLSSSKETILIQGIIDAYIEYEDRVILIDYKTDRVRKEDTLIKRYSIQLDYYARALSMMKQKKVAEKIIWSFALNKSITC